MKKEYIPHPNLKNYVPDSMPIREVCKSHLKNLSEQDALAVRIAYLVSKTWGIEKPSLYESNGPRFYEKENYGKGNARNILRKERLMNSLIRLTEKRFKDNPEGLRQCFDNPIDHKTASILVRREAGELYLDLLSGNKTEDRPLKILEFPYDPGDQSVIALGRLYMEAIASTAYFNLTKDTKALQKPYLGGICAKINESPKGLKFSGEQLKFAEISGSALEESVNDGYSLNRAVITENAMKNSSNTEHAGCQSNINGYALESSNNSGNSFWGAHNSGHSLKSSKNIGNSFELAGNYDFSLEDSHNSENSFRQAFNHDFSLKNSVNSGSSFLHSSTNGTSVLENAEIGKDSFCESSSRDFPIKPDMRIQEDRVGPFCIKFLMRCVEG